MRRHTGLYFCISLLKWDSDEWRIGWLLFGLHDDTGQGSGTKCQIWWLCIKLLPKGSSHFFVRFWNRGVVELPPLFGTPLFCIRYQYHPAYNIPLFSICNPTKLSGKWSISTFVPTKSSKIEHTLTDLPFSSWSWPFLDVELPPKTFVETHTTSLVFAIVNRAHLPTVVMPLFESMMVLIVTCMQLELSILIHLRYRYHLSLYEDTWTSTFSCQDVGKGQVIKELCTGFGTGKEKVDGNDICGY